MPHTTFRILMVTLGLLAMATIPASAQIPVPQPAAPNAEKEVPQSRTANETVPSTTAPARIDPFTPNEVKTDPTNSYSGIQRTPEAEAETQQMRQKEREQELTTQGFKWQPWSAAGPKIEAFITARNPDQSYITSPPQYRDFAVTDLDKDEEPDVIVYNWSDCVAAGCPYVIYFGKEGKKPRSFIVRQIKKHLKGIQVDNGMYFKL